MERASAVDLAENIGRQLAADTRHTDQGRQDQFKNHVLHQAVPVFHQGRRAISRAKQELEEMRGRLQLPKGDPTDAAGAAARREWLGGMSQSERDKITSSENSNPQIRGALLDPNVPAALMTGVAESHLKLLKEKALTREARHLD